MSLRKWIQSLFPNGFLWRLSFLNIVVVASAIVLSGLAIYNTACFLVDAMGNLNDSQQTQFNAILFNYLLIFSGITIVGGSLLHFYLTRKLIKPVRSLIVSAKQLKKGEYPELVEATTRDEVGELALHFNGLVKQLKTNDEHRQKLISDLSHELRTPLTNLNGYLQALEHGDIDGSQELYKSLHGESKRLTSMLEQLEQLKEWDYAASRAYVQYTEADMADLISQCTDMFSWRLEQENIPITVDAESSELSVHIAGVQQVISNLLENAIQYYTGSGAIKIWGELQKSSYCVSVSGPSEFIPEDEAEHIFQRFYRLDQSRNRASGGSGLGLSIAREIVENHGGRIGLTSGGSYNTFWFEIPL
ncbi:sensor histidine kinase [Lentibacillus amyloliquefaciens]|uniref:histidine kinase n=1 Tax=Lentibacillus amyloliquefaciens TaxID=1472767 RepID=A0A0U3NQM4_9BACI|nr:ATP-binding protein [Lentibacillus amyloliquefaciens]ALX49019.1 histidine kinase [Lentibacillus amyloliquefaciens]